MIKDLKELLKFFLFYLYKKKIISVSYKKKDFRFIISDKISFDWYTGKNLLSSESKIFNYFNSKIIKKTFYFGAHQCVIPIILQKVFLKNSYIKCFEVLPSNIRNGKKNIVLNNSNSRIELLNIGLNNIKKKIPFSCLLSNSSYNNETFFKLMVDCQGFNYFFLKYGCPDLIILDVEGMEGRVINNLVNLIKNFKKKPKLFIECHDKKLLNKHKSGAHEIYNALKKCDYEIFSLTKKSNDFKKFIKFEGFLNYRHYILAL
jgi:FkbM family methyltransferase